ncbi:MAG: hypothetical protein AB1649_16965 [Chloroflexota bacterium]
MDFYKGILLGMTIILVSSCSLMSKAAEQSAISTPDIEIEVQNQEYLEVTAPEGWNSYKTIEPVALLIRNISETGIVADADFGARIFLHSEDEWIEVQNKAVYPSTDPINLEPNKEFDPMKVEELIVFPDLPDDSVVSQIRIFLVGTLVRNEKESETVATFIDMTLTP